MIPNESIPTRRSLLSRLKSWDNEMVASCPLEAPELGISREQGQLVLMAPLHAVGFHLMTAESLNGPWQDAGMTPTVMNDHFCWALQAGGGAKFFRLQSR